MRNNEIRKIMVYRETETTRSLQRAVRILCSHLEAVLRNIDREGPSFDVNASGIIQSMGNVIDRLVRELIATRELEKKILGPREPKKQQT